MSVFARKLSVFVSSFRDLLGGFMVGVLLVCCLLLLGRTGTRVVAGVPAEVLDDGLPKPEQSPLKTYASATDGSTAEDLDGDGMPNTWETANGLDQNDASDAASDFDRDGLTALQEYQHGTSPLGEWSRRIIDTSGLPGWVQYIYPVGISDSGSVIFTGEGSDPDTGNWQSRAWLRTKDGALHEITHPDATYVYAYDLNADDEVVGYGYDANSTPLPFIWSPQDGWQDFDTPPGVTGPVYPQRINSWGDVLLRDGNQNSVLIDPLGNVIDIIGDDWTSPQVTDINDFREAIGTYTHAGKKMQLDLKAPIDEVSYRYPRSFNEVAPFVVASRTRAVGAEGRTEGSILEKVNMGEEYRFGDTHSAEWQWRFQKTYKFYHDFMESLDLDPIPIPNP